MRVSFIGAGYVGLVTAIAFAEVGNRVNVVEKETYKLEKLKKGVSPFFEPGLDDILYKLLKDRKIFFYKDLKETIHDSEIIFIAVGTPPLPTGEADLSGLINISTQVGKLMRDYKVIVVKSTAPVGTCNMVEKIIKENQKHICDFDVVSNPEFLREGTALEDARNPSRIVLGCSSKKAIDITQQLYKPFNAPIIVTDSRSSEMIKYASNAFLATKISFINEIANICDRVDADVEQVAKGMGLDNRIGPDFLRAGIGYGGSCFPKDTKGVIQIAGHVAHDFKLLRAVVEVNNLQWKKTIEKLKMAVGTVKNKTIAIWGLSFKPNTDDIREAPSIEIIKEIINSGGVVKAYDPVINSRVGNNFEGVFFCKDPYAAANEADAVILVTEWDVFKKIDLKLLYSIMRNPVLIDGRNAYEPRDMIAEGFAYFCVGRPANYGHGFDNKNIYNINRGI